MEMDKVKISDKRTQLYEVRFRDNSFQLPDCVVMENKKTVSIFGYSGLYYGDFLREEIKALIPYRS